MSISFYLSGAFLMAQVFSLLSFFLSFFLSLPSVSVSDTYRKYPGKMSRSFTSINKKLINFNNILLLLSYLIKYDPLRRHGLQHTKLPCPSLSLESVFKLMSIESVLPSNHLSLCYSLLLLPSIFPSIRVSQRAGFSHQMAKVLISLGLLKETIFTVTHRHSQ